MTTGPAPATHVADAARTALDAVAADVGFARAVVDGTARGPLWCDRETGLRVFHAVHPCGCPWCGARGSARRSTTWSGTCATGPRGSGARSSRGGSTAAAGALVDRLLSDGVQPVWSCREGNAGSERLAASLGFVVVRRGPYLHLPAR